MRRAGLQICGRWSPHHQKFSLVVWTTQATVKQGSICYMLGGYNPMLWGFKGERNHYWLVFYRLDSGSLSVCISCEVKTQTETVTGQGCGGNAYVILHPQSLFSFQGFVSFCCLNLFSPIQCCRSQPHIHTTVSLPLWETRKEEDRSERMIVSLILEVELNCKLV